MGVDYEWCVEIVLRETEDIEDNNFVTSLEEAISFVHSEEDSDEYEYKIVLVRSEGNDDNGITDRLWAYMEEGSLPELFSNAYGNTTQVKVPQKYQKEAKRCSFGR
jgi:hypothetical protein